ncbi:CTP-dependent diacylglycerol kinase [Rhypophila decipiens]|uniref:CTP-dependent diacylglycerol kinase n=1 Tax=Rhypophila decipiens TaxID=261697 RepID=A0AAN7B6V0_9PEZI|nr:CTP-dependent diacylglycerol kinase [Rhypophila decipiens]
MPCDVFSHAVESSRSAASSPLFTLDPIVLPAAAFCFGTQSSPRTTPSNSSVDFAAAASAQPLTATAAPTSPITSASAASATLSPIRESRKDKHIHSTTSSSHSFWPLRLCAPHHRLIAGVVQLPALPPFPYNMSAIRGTRQTVPATPRVISPSPTPSESDASARDSYLGPTTRSAARRRLATPQPVQEEDDIDEEEYTPGLRRSRTRSRSPLNNRKVGRLTSMSSSSVAGANGHAKTNGPSSSSTGANGDVVTADDKSAATKVNGHLSLPSTATVGGGWSWRDFSRSPSPLGLIPIHRHWRTFVHKHEVPRKALHVSIGFFVVWLYLSGTQTYAVCPYLMAALVPIAAVDVLRHHYQPFNRFYVRVLGALMRESEFNGYNGVIFYLLGAWIVLYSFPKDVGVMGTLLLSWCDTAASTFGRLYGRYTPRLRRGKSLAGSLAAFFVGVGTAAWFWGWLAPRSGPFPGDETFMFTGALRLPDQVAGLIGLTPAQATIKGGLALGVMSVWSGFVAAASEVVDLFGWDDNLTIPVLSGLGIWGFLKVFG